ncbi:hypothetical protein NDU88_001542 [Pleurodeles waltl]|uniref:Uncharacterized protein n=1 Tax=Pleurodeles waltl TaxID=8319 RepID=A0AAV7NDQ1_PLEWA|nr:hypothetical protein NDU88_001542 [Pleurodeles waltl]
MPVKGGKMAKTKGLDPGFTQLLKMLLAKLSDGGEGGSLVSAQEPVSGQLARPTIANQGYPVLTVPGAPSPTLFSTITDLQMQFEALVKVGNRALLELGLQRVVMGLAGSIDSTTAASSVKVTEGPVKDSCPVGQAMGGQDTLFSRPGKLALHESAETKENIWKGEFVDIFFLIRPKRREGEVKEKEGKDNSSKEKKPKVEELIANWLFEFNVFMTVMLEKKQEQAVP